MTASDSPTTAQQSHLGCLFFDFVPPRAFNFDQKHRQNVALSRDKIVSSLLELIDRLLLISEYVLEKH